MRLENKVVMVIGGGSCGAGVGNGKAISIISAREGAKVFVVDINPAAARETAEIVASEGGDATHYAADVTKSAEVNSMVESCMESYGRIDVLFHNVGIVSPSSVVDMSEEEWNKVLSVNMTSAFLTYKHVLPVMEKQGEGVVIATGSIAGMRYTGVPYISYYATKSAVEHMTQCVAMQYAEKGIRANTIVPGLMDTPMIHQGLSSAYSQGDEEAMVRKRNQQCPTGSMGDAWDVANAAVFLASEEAKYITATSLVVDGGITAKFA